jgi:peptidoglycan DL-endopeptidase CwlO
MASRKGAAIAAAFGVAMALGQSHHGHRHGSGNLLSAFTSPAAPSHAARVAIRYARAQIGKPYLWGGTGPDAFDCSGLVMQAYASAGVNLPRTSQQQWASGTRVSSQQPGDLVFFAGADGTTASPGHVGLVIGHDRMIEAYAPGYPVRISHFGTPGSPAGDQNPVGFTDPTAGG